MMNSSRVIKNYLNGLFMKRVMVEKGWSKEEAARHLKNVLNCGKQISVSQYLKSL